MLQIEGEAAERSLAVALVLMNSLRWPAERLEVFLDADRRLTVTLVDHRVIPGGGAWTTLTISRGGLYRAFAEVEGRPGDLSFATHFPGLSIEGDADAALSDLSAWIDKHPERKAS